MLKQRLGSSDLTTDIHRFWEQTGSFYISGRGNDNLADPFAALSFIPAATGIFRDMTGAVSYTHLGSDCSVSGAAGRHYRYADAGAEDSVRKQAPQDSGALDGG